jgi:indolepyruvate ferredoxin oxidoreductase
MKVDPRFLKEEGAEVFTGNELIVKGLLETEGGSHLWTGYPGSPVAGVFDCIEAIQELPKHYGIYARMANNEALSAAMVNGSQMTGLRAITVMKSVGLHVASDALAIGNLAGAHPEGGALVVSGDDPWSDSTQVPADSRYLFKHMHMPVLEPSTNQELKDWIDLGFKLSRESELYIGYLVTTNQADGGGTVTVHRNQFPKVNTHQRTTLETAAFDLEKMVLLPPRTWRREQDLPHRYARLWASAKKYKINQLSLPASPPRAKKSPLGFITSALAASYLEHALAELGLTKQFPVLKLGLTYPLDPSLIEEFSHQAEVIIVVEERRGFLEEQIALILSQLGLSQTTRLYGKKFPASLPGFPESRGLNPSIIIQTLGPLFLNYADLGLQLDRDRIESELRLIALTEKPLINLIARTPTFCAGCPHRDSASVLVEIKKEFRDTTYMRQHHRREPVDLVFHGDTGCYTMLMFEPTKDLMHNYSGMGLGGGTGLGIDPFIANKQVVFMGDSTFFHSGQIAISNSVKNNQDITYIILDNSTTAMTGHQPTPGMDTDIVGNTTHAQSIDKIVQGIADQPGVEIIRTNPELREQYRTLLEDIILKDGVKVIIADKECGITFHRRRHRQERAETKTRGYLPQKTFININSDVCEYCLECTKATGCPGLTFSETNLGRKIQTDLTWCVSDTACTKIDACPAFEEITVIRHQKPLSRLPKIEDRDLPTPPQPPLKRAWHIYLAGVGGMGIASATATLVRSAHREGYSVLFCDKNGLAIRNGGVFSHITFLPPGHAPTSQIIPYGKADLLLGVDALEGARALDPSGNQRIASPTRTTALLNLAKTPTIHGLLGKEDFCIETLSAEVRSYTLAKSFFGFDVSTYSERLFGTKIYANIMMLGVAFQRGQLPLSLSSIEWAIRESLGSAASENYLAFKLGRKLVLDHASSPPLPDSPDYNAIIAEKSVLLKKQPQGERLAQHYWQLATRGLSALQLSSADQAYLAHRIYDLLNHTDLAYAADYVDRLIELHRHDSAHYHYQATSAALWNLHRVMAIKDEIYVAHLLTSEEKYARDRERYHINPELGDQAHYGHLNRPEFVLGSHKIRFKIKTRPWMLRLMSRAKFLRRVLPGWHAEERRFCLWYQTLLTQFRATTPESYHIWLTLLRLPEQCTGYREVRYPKMRHAQERAAVLLRQTSAEPQISRQA